jgi:hypothetical protein
MHPGDVAMQLNRRGFNRWVLLTARRAYKFPAPYSWRSFLYGLLNNMNEAQQARGKSYACPIVWRLPLGFLNVMPRCKPLNERQFAALDVADFCRTNRLVVEHKIDSFGVLNGLIVAVDYGWPRELRW